MNNTCPKSSKCPIFQGGVLKRENSEKVYRNLYCNAGASKYETCMRYKISELIGKPAPLTVLPNCSKPIEDIIENME
ncbi:MAG: hypothetical protein JXR60_08585 [Bacteroidales bacterium]|nr:hypothetical protein [Bacteroidales bacterium]